MYNMEINFKGICPPHKIGKIYVYPIHKDLSKLILRIWKVMLEVLNMQDYTIT